MASKIYAMIRHDIIFGVLAPGTRLRLEAARSTYDTGISTLREIFHRLASEGFVQAKDNKGFRVAPVNNAELDELAELRILLESHALRQSFANGDIDWESQVVAAHHILQVQERGLLAGKTVIREDWKRADWEFHSSLIAACGSRQLLDIHQTIYDRYLRYQMLTLTFRGEPACQEHRQLFNAALTRDADLACSILAKHIRFGVEHSRLVDAEPAQRVGQDA